MRRARIIIVLLMSCYGVFAQKTKAINTDGYARVPNSPVHVFKTDFFKYLRYDGFKVIDFRKATPDQLQRIKARERIVKLQEDRFWGLYVNSNLNQFPRRSLALRFEKNTGAKVYDGLRWRWGTLYKNTILIDGKSDVEVIDGLITLENAKNYRYRVIQNDNKELVGWTTPSVFKKTMNDSATYCLLGNLKYQKNQFILIEIYNINNYKDRDAIIIDWRETRPFAFWTTVDYRSKHYGNAILSASLGSDRKTTNVNFIETDTLKDIKIRLGDSLVRLGFQSHHQPTSYNYVVVLKRTINGVNERVELGETNGTLLLYKEFWNKPGKYEITFTPKLRNIGGTKIKYLNEKEVSYKFTILPDLNFKLVFSQRESLLIGLAIMVVLGLIILGVWYFIKRKSQRKLAVAQQQKELSKTQLNSIRSQLNPHFMFNALAGIQNLMNTNKIDEANRYLGKFARLTRNVLDGKELISLAEEKTLLEDYLQMEQFRFGFTYQMDIVKELNLDNIEIPTMLLQPFVENAVKHGISEMGAAGKIEVSFIKENQNLILNVKDNGKGFAIDQNYTGLGLQLSKNRISLLNTIYYETSFSLDMKSSENGSEITITLNQWL